MCDITGQSPVVAGCQLIDQWWLGVECGHIVLHYGPSCFITLIVLGKRVPVGRMSRWFVEFCCCGHEMCQESSSAHPVPEKALLLIMNQRKKLFCSSWIRERSSSAHHESEREALLLIINQREKLFCSSCIRERSPSLITHQRKKPFCSLHIRERSHSAHHALEKDTFLLIMRQSSVQFSSVKDDVDMQEKACMCFAVSVRSFPTANAFETVPVLVSLTMFSTRPCKEDYQGLPLSTAGNQWCNSLGFVPTGSVSSSSTSDLPRCSPLTLVALLTTLIAQSFPSILLCPRHSQESSRLDVEHCHMLILASYSTCFGFICSKLIRLEKEALVLIMCQTKVFCSPCIRERISSAHHASEKEALLCSSCIRLAEKGLLSSYIREGSFSSHHASGKESSLAHLALEKEGQLIIHQRNKDFLHQRKKLLYSPCFRDEDSSAGSELCCMSQNCWLSMERSVHDRLWREQISSWICLEDCLLVDLRHTTDACATLS